MQRQKTLRKITGPNTIQQLEHIDLSDAKRVVFGGYVAKTIYADMSSAKLVGNAQHVLITNGSGATIFVAVDDTGTVIPSATTGIAVLNNTQVVIGTGAHKYIKASAAVQGVLLEK